jgi:hypothetical protein
VSAEPPDAAEQGMSESPSSKRTRSSGRPSRSLESWRITVLVPVPGSLAALRTSACPSRVIVARAWERT